LKCAQHPEKDVSAQGKNEEIWEKICSPKEKRGRVQKGSDGERLTQREFFLDRKKTETEKID
jgi:hypothetical protein